MTTQMTARKSAPAARTAPKAPTLKAVPKEAPIAEPETAAAPATKTGPIAVPTAPATAAPTAASAPAGSTTASAPAKPALPSRVELVQLSKATWRVCDAAGVPGERGYIVGYLEQLDDGFEMLWMHPRPGVVQRHAAFDEAVRAIAIRLRMFTR
jgi:hypothetical protein